MYSPLIRIIIGILGLGVAYKYYSMGNMTGAIMLLVAVGLIVWGYFRGGTVFIAFQQIKKGNYKKAEQLILTIKNPNLLKKSQRGYYHFAKGVIELNNQNYEVSRSEHVSALELGLRTENDTAIVYLNLASIELELKNFEKAKNYLIKTKNTNHKVDLNSEIMRIEKAINTAR